jgi:hypothetical protein
MFLAASPGNGSFPSIRLNRPVDPVVAAPDGPCSYHLDPLILGTEMADPLRLRLLQRELELMSAFAAGVVEDFDRAVERSADPEEIIVLTRALVAAALKVSRLLWPFGRRAGDDLNVEEAGAIRLRLGLKEDHVLAPIHTVPLAAVLTLRHDELLAVLDQASWSINLGDEIHQLGPVMEALANLHSAISHQIWV